MFCCCKCQVYVRWPVRGPLADHPRLSFATLVHDHTVDKGVVDEVRRQTKPLDTPTKNACGKLTDRRVLRQDVLLVCLVAVAIDMEVSGEDVEGLVSDV